VTLNRQFLLLIFPNTSKIEGEIGWKAKKTLDEIIVDVVNHEKKVLA